MKRALLCFLGVAILGWGQLSGQNVLAKWTFQTGSPGGFGSPGTTPTPSGGFLTANEGSGTATALHASNSSLWFVADGNGSTAGFAATTWSVGDYFQFSTSSTGFSGINVRWDQISSADGPRDFTFSYSLDGSSFTVLNSFATSDSPNWNSSTAQSGTATNFSVDLSAVSAVANSGTVYFRLTSSSTTSVAGGAIGGFGYTALDNFTISGAAIPESATFTLWMALLSVAGIMGWRRLRVTSLR